MGNAELKQADASDEGFVDELPAGSTLMHGQYTIDRFLNAGGFGITYAARDSLDRKVVIKECFPGAFCRRSHALVNARSRAHQNELQNIVRLFVQEAKSLSKLDHPNIVGVHQVFEENNTAYMALDYVEGRDLLEVIEDGIVDLTPELTASILRKVLDAVAFIHDQGILHRDISPDNILLDNEMEPVLIDFGAAREEATQKSRVLTAMRVVKDGYSPQEFYISGSEQGPYSDLYALGASFYHLITKELPPNSQARLAAIASGEPDPYKPVMWRANGFDVDFLAALDRSLEVLPKDRIRSATDWMAMLDGRMAVPGKNAKAGDARAGAASGSAAAVASKRAADPSKKSSKMGLLLASVAALALIAGVVVTQTDLLGTGAGNLGNTGVANGTAETPSEPSGNGNPDTPTLPVDPELAALGNSLSDDKRSVLLLEGAPSLSQPDAASAGVAVNNAGLRGFVDPDLPKVTVAALTAPSAPDARPGESVVADPRGVPTDPAMIPGNIAEAADVSPLEDLFIIPPVLAVETSSRPPLRPRSPVPEALAALAVKRITQPELVIDITSLSGSRTVDPIIPRTFVPALQKLVLGQSPDADIRPAAEPLPEVVEQNVAGLAAGWSLALPYAGLFNGSEGETRIFAVNGTPVADQTAFDAIASRVAGNSSAPFAEVTIAIGTSPGNQTEQTWQLPVVRSVKLINGMEFRASFENDTWVTRVTRVPAELNLDLEAGDVIFGNLATSEAIDTQDALLEIFTRQIEAGETEFLLAVSRDGNNWAVPFTYNPLGGG